MLNSKTRNVCMHSFTFARLVKSVMTAAEPLSACDIEIEQVHILVMSTLP